MARALRIPARSKRMSELRQLRMSLPFETYLSMLHQAALTGKMPRLDPYTHRPITIGGQIQADEIETKDRLEILRELVKKGLPNIAQTSLEAEAAHDPADPTTLTSANADPSRIEEAQLRLVLDTDYEELAQDPNDAQDPD